MKNIKKLSRVALKTIKGSERVLPVNCYTLCGEAGGVISTRPGVGDMCNSERTICCYCR